MKKESVIRVIEACVLLVIGVLFCVSLAMGTQALSIILGASLIAAGTVIVILSAINEKTILSAVAMGGLLALSLGIFFIVRNAIGYIMEAVPFVLIVFGSALLIDAFIGYYARKEKVIAIFVIKLIVAAALITVGILLLTVSGFGEYVALIVGIALILLAIDCIALEFIKAKKE